MSFRIFASGSARFNYVKDNCIDGGDFNTVQVLGLLQGMEPSVTGAIGAASDLVLPSAGITNLAQALAHMEFFHLLVDSVTSLAMSNRAGAARAGIGVFCRNKHPLWPDTTSFSLYDFSPGDSPGVEFFRAIRTGLEETDLNNWGVLLELAIVVNKYAEHIDGTNTTPMLNISLSH